MDSPEGGGNRKLLHLIFDGRTRPFDISPLRPSSGPEPEGLSGTTHASPTPGIVTKLHRHINSRQRCIFVNFKLTSEGNSICSQHSTQ
jgi:hypothetical protein